jgi:hypothetical protein
MSHPLAAELLRDGVVVAVVWAITVLTLGRLLTRPRRRPLTGPTPPSETPALTRDDFILAA